MSDPADFQVISVGAANGEMVVHLVGDLDLDPAIASWLRWPSGLTPWDRSTCCESQLPRMSGRRRLITMARRRHTPEQVIRKLREADRLLAEGAEIADVARHLEVSEQTYHRWRNQYGGMKADDAKRLRELERENAALKRIVADKELENLALREIAKGNW
jgi:putative transposase